MIHHRIFTAKPLDEKLRGDSIAVDDGGAMFHGGFHTMIRKSILTAGLLGATMLLTGCVTPYVSGTVGTRVGSGGYISGTVGGYPYGYGGYGGYDRYGYRGASVYGYDRYGNPIYRLPDGRLVTGHAYNNYDRYYGYPGYGYPGYGYPSYGYPGYGYPGYRVMPPRYNYPSRPHYPRPSTGQNEGGATPPVAQPPRRSTGGSSSGDILRQARQVRERQIEP